MGRPTVGTARRRTAVLLLTIAALVGTMLPTTVVAVQPGAGNHDPEVTPARARERKIPGLPGMLSRTDEQLLKRDDAFITARTAGDSPLSVATAGRQRSLAVAAANALKKAGPPQGPATFNGAWAEISPDPIVQVNRGSASFYAVSGRIGGLAIRPSNGQKILGGAQGGIWTYDEATGTWTSRTDNAATLSIGDIAIAPSNDSIIYAGTGEGELSGDSYRGLGVMKSTDGGMTWNIVSGNAFAGVSISKVVVHPTNPDRLWIAVIRGRAGSRRQTPPTNVKYGIYESQNGGTSWVLRKDAGGELTGATDLVIDPQEPNVLYASFWGDAIYESTDSGLTWHEFMDGIPEDATFETGGGTRFALGLSRPAGMDRVLYAGFEWTDGEGEDQPSQVWKSVDGGAWQLLPSGTGLDSVLGYCGIQCFYDNVIGVDPTDPNTVYVLGLFNYNSGSGGIFRSTDGGQTWKDMGWDLHPDYHAIAINPANPSQVMIGSDGGVWYSENKGGRLGTEPVQAVDWENLNGTVDPNTAAVTHRTGLKLTQFTSIATVPTLPARFWGGTQDNGTMRKSTLSNSWFDVEGGDGGQVLVDPTDASYVYGEYFGISPYRNTDGGAFFFSNEFITNGIDLNDRSEFYVPQTLNRGNPNQLFLGTYRLYRTDNAKAPEAADVFWNPISGDLTSGCEGGAPNGARGCFISAIGVSDAGERVYVGTLEGWIQTAPDAVSSLTPTWSRSRDKDLPNRPVADFAVDRSNDRIAYVAYNGFNLATPKTPGHVFATTDGGATWRDISANLPDAPVNSIELDASFPGTIYAGTDVGPFVTYNGGGSWSAMGTGFPTVQIWQLDLDPSNRNIAAGTHGRGAFVMHDAAEVPALVVSKIDSKVPVGPNKTINYTLTIRNIGNADATGVKVVDPIPADTVYAGSDNGGSVSGPPSKRIVTWSGLAVPAGESIQLELRVQIDPTLKKKVMSVVNDGVTVTSAQGIGATGSAHVTPIAPPFDVRITPASQTDGGRVGTSVTYQFEVTNLGFNDDTYDLSADGTFDATVLDATCTDPMTSVSVASGASADVCVSVAIPEGAANDARDTATVTATSGGDASVSDSGTATTIAVALDTLLVDGDNDIPDVQDFYAAALDGAGVTYNVWDLAEDPNLPGGYMNAHTNIVWFTGNSWPEPITQYGDRLAAFLDNGGRLAMSGQDILDQNGGTTDFVHDYLHIDWDGSETQNDKPTDNVHSEDGNIVTDGIGTIALDPTVLGTQFTNRLTLIDPATVAFRDDAGEPDGLTVEVDGYKVFFVSFPIETYGTADDREELFTRIFTWFGT